MYIKQRVVINKPVHQVFAYITDVQRLAAWVGTTFEAQPLSPGPVGVGWTFCTVGKVLLLGQRTQATWEVVEYVADRCLTLKSIAGLVPTVVQWTFTSVVRGTQCSEAITGDLRMLPLAEPLLVRANRRQLAHDLLMLKELLEG